MRITITDINKPAYILVRDTPSGTIRISGTFTHLDNAKKELKSRLEFSKSNNLQNKPEGWGEPYLIEVNIATKKLDLD